MHILTIIENELSNNPQKPPNTQGRGRKSMRREEESSLSVEGGRLTRNGEWEETLKRKGKDENENKGTARSTQKSNKQTKTR